MEFKDLILNALKKLWFVKEDEHGVLYYQMERYDYEDRLDADDVVDLLNAEGNWEEEYHDKLLEATFYDYDHFIEEAILEQIEKDIGKEEYEKIDIELSEELNYAINDYLDIRIPEYLEDEIGVQISIATYGDANQDLTLNGSYDWSDSMWINYLMEDPDANESTLLWLIEQQGYTKEDFIDAIEGINTNKFFESILTETTNVTSPMNALTFLGTMTIRELLEVNAGTRNVVIPKDTYTGLFDGWSGGGSMFDIELDKAVEVPADMIFKVLPADAKGGRLGFYTVQDVYGFSSRVFDTKFAVK